MFSQFFIYRPIFACVISIVVVLIGGISIPLLSVEQTPDITPPTVSVSTTYPGASPEVIADTVATPIEAEVNGVEGMIYMESKSTDDGTYELTVTFEVGTDVDMATVLVQNRVNVAMSKLPEEVTRQGVKTEKKSTNIVLMVNMISPNGEFDEILLSNYVTQNIQDELARVKGVGSVQVMGAKDFSMRIWLDPEKLKARRLTTTDVINAVREQNVQVAAGTIGGSPAPSDQKFQYTINTLGRLKTTEEFENIIIKVGEERRTVRLKDVAELELGAASYNWSVDFNGKPSIAVAIYQLPGSNSLEVANGIRAKMADLKKSFPPAVDFDIAYDTTMFVKASIVEVVNTLVVAVILVVLTVYVFLQDVRATLIPALTIPVSLIGTFAVMMALGISINTLSLFGIVLAIGIVVDDAIVVVENTMRLIDQEKLGSKAAAAKAMMEVTGPVVATTLVLLAVFVPTAMMGGITGRLYSQFALTISTATIFSSINALTLSPALCGMLLRPTPEKKNIFFRGFDAVFDAGRFAYAGILRLIVRRMLLTVLLLGAIIGGTVMGFLRIPGGFIPDEDQGYFIVSAQLPNGATINRTQEVAEQVREIVQDTEGVRDYILISGYSGLNSIVVPNSATAFVVLDPWEERQTPQLRLRAILFSVFNRLRSIQEAQVLAFAPPPITGLGNATGFDYRLQDRGGAGINQLDETARTLVAEGEGQPNLSRLNSNFTTTFPQYYLDVDREKAKRLGISLNEIFGTLQTNLGSAYINDFSLNSRNYKVMAQADAPFRSRKEDIAQLQVRDRDGNMIPLSTLVSVEDTAGPNVLYRYNNYPAATITGQPAPGYSSGEAVTAMEQLSSQVLPPGLAYEWSGVTFQQLAAGNSAPFIFAMAIVFVYLFLSAQYESWMIPWAVVLGAPLAIGGALLATWARSFDNNVYTQIGLVLLIGLASKTAILIVEFARQLRSEGKSIKEAAVEASGLRFRAVLMTAISFILGILPLLVASGAGAASRQALGTAVFGGMSAATVVGVFLTPMLFVLIQSLTELGGSPKRETSDSDDANSADKVESVVLSNGEPSQSLKAQTTTSEETASSAENTAATNEESDSEPAEPSTAKASEEKPDEPQRQG